MVTSTALLRVAAVGVADPPSARDAWWMGRTPSAVPKCPVAETAACPIGGTVSRFTPQSDQTSTLFQLTSCIVAPARVAAMLASCASPPRRDGSHDPGCGARGRVMAGRCEMIDDTECKPLDAGIKDAVSTSTATDTLELAIGPDHCGKLISNEPVSRKRSRSREAVLLEAMAKRQSSHTSRTSPASASPRVIGVVDSRSTCRLYGLRLPAPSRPRCSSATP